MKKVLSVLLCVVMLCSCICLFAFAEDTAPAETFTYTFYDEDGTTVLGAVTAQRGESPVGPTHPTKPRVDGDPEWVFSGWRGDDGEIYYSSSLPAATKDMTFVATYKDPYNHSDEGDITLMSFLASIFARINKLFKQISTYFEELTKSVQNLMG